MAREEWEFSTGGVKFFCWRDDAGKTHGTACESDQAKIEDIARLLRAHGWGATVTKDGQWYNLSISDDRSPVGGISVYEGDGVPVLEPKKQI